MTNHLSLVHEDESGHERLESWMRAHERSLRRMCARLLRDDALAEDIVQETLLRAWARRAQFESDADMGPWLRCVARNLCIEVLRTRGRMIPSSEALPDHPDLDADPTAPLERAEEHRTVREVLATLSERHRALLVARDVEGVDYAELARREGVNEDAARAVLFRARRILRERYLAAAKATGAVLAWLRLRAGTATRRGLEPSLTAAGASIVSGAAGLAIVIAVVAGMSAGRSPSPTTPSHPAAASPSIGSAVSVSSSAAEPGGSSGALGEVAGASVNASLDRRSGSAGAGAKARNPVTGNDEHVWTRVWRDHGGGDSVVLSSADEAADAGCDSASQACDSIDSLLPTDPGSPTP